MDSPAEQLVGAVFNGRWKLGRLLGEGGMGAVYEAYGTRGEGARAIKVLHAEYVGNEAILGRFLAEAQACQALDHPNIARIFEQGTAEDGTPYLVMELLKGMPLSHYIEQRRALTPEQAAPIVYGILEALMAAARQRIVHRDLKPDNVFLVEDGSGGYAVKVLDFGIAKVMDAAGGIGQKTRTGVLLGTPGYMSPEQIKNAKGVDPRSDLWSVGILLYEMLSAADPFPADNEFARLTAVLTQEVRPIAEVAPHLAGWSGFFQRALSKDITQRFQSAEEMAQALVATARGPAPAPASAVRKEWATVALPVMSAHGTTAMPAMPHAATPTGPSGQGVSGQGVSGQGVSGHGISAPGVSAPPAAPLGPSTFVSHGAQTGPSTLQGGGGPSVPVVMAPALGAPWWVVGTVGAACLALGFLLGYLVGS